MIGRSISKGFPVSLWLMRKLVDSEECASTRGPIFPDINSTDDSMTHVEKSTALPSSEWVMSVFGGFLGSSAFRGSPAGYKRCACCCLQNLCHARRSRGFFSPYKWFTSKCNVSWRYRSMCSEDLREQRRKTRRSRPKRAWPRPDDKVKSWLTQRLNVESLGATFRIGTHMIIKIAERFAFFRWPTPLQLYCSNLTES